MLPGQAVPGSCLASFHFRWAIHPIRPVYSEMRGHIRTHEMRLRVATCVFPILKTLKGEAAFHMENLFKTRNEGGGAKLTSCFKFPFKAGM